jgi:colanic acid/amylovoran biosynthesis glycosyltransferase
VGAEWARLSLGPVPSISLVLLASDVVQERVAYVLSDYPKLSQSFIRDEISAVEERGLGILRIAINPAADADAAASGNRAEADRTFYVKAQSPARVLRCILIALWTSPSGFVQVLCAALRSGGSDMRRSLRGVFYFVESIIVWDHCRGVSVRRLHAHFAHPVANVAWLAAAFGTRADPGHPWSWSVTIHGPHDFYVEPLLGMEQKARSAAAIVCISDYGRAQVMRMISPRLWPKVVVGRCGIDLGRFPLRAPRPVTQRPRIVSVGRLAPEKGQTQLVTAVALLVDRGFDVQVDFIGDGPAREAIELEARARGVSERIHLLGEMPSADVVAHLLEADVFCLPSFGEGIPISIMEAMAIGVPVLCTAVGGVSELALDGRTGVVVPPGRPDKIADGIALILSDESYRTTLVDAARRAISESYDLRRNVSELITVLRSDGIREVA